MSWFKLLRDRSGAAVIEMAFALPCLVLLIWMMTQLGLVYRATSGMQHALGEGARLATIYPQPDDEAIEDRMEEAVYGVGPGDFSFSIDRVEDDEDTEVDESNTGYIELNVSYTQATDMLLMPGPTITINKTKRVWVAE